MTAPTVFVSYSWDSDSHCNWVRKLAVDLQNAGVHALLDQWDVHPGTNLQQYMELSISSSTYVVLICTPSYAQKSRQSAGGVAYDKGIVTGEMFIDAASEAKFVPLLRKGTASEGLPSYMKSRVYIDFTQDAKYRQSLEELLRHVYRAPRFSRPALGARPDFSEPPRKSHSTASNTRRSSSPQDARDHLEYLIGGLPYRVALPQWWHEVSANLPARLPKGDFRAYVTRVCRKDTGTSTTWRAAFKLWAKYEMRRKEPFPVYLGHCLRAGSQHLSAARLFAELQTLAPHTDTASWYATYLAYCAGAQYRTAGQVALAKTWLEIAASARASPDNAIAHYAKLSDALLDRIFSPKRRGAT